MSDYAYHWSPMSRRKGIARVGLKPGSLSRHRQWRPPFIAYSRDPEYALRSADVYDPIVEPMDLWQIDLDGLAHEDLSLLHDEIRVYERVPFRDLLWIATRRAGDDPIPKRGDET